MEPTPMRRRLAATLLVAALTTAATAATAAAGPKRGTYIDVKLQTYITTTKDVSAVKSFQTTCVRSTGVQGGSIVVSRKLKLNRSGGFSFSGKGKIYGGDPKPYIDTVKIKASYKNGRFKGTVEIPEKYGCAPSSFSAKYYGVNPKG